MRQNGWFLLELGGKSQLQKAAQRRRIYRKPTWDVRITAGKLPKIFELVSVGRWWWGEQYLYGARDHLSITCCSNYWCWRLLLLLLLSFLLCFCGLFCDLCHAAWWSDRHSKNCVMNTTLPSTLRWPAKPNWPLDAHLHIKKEISTGPRRFERYTKNVQRTPKKAARKLASHWKFEKNHVRAEKK